MISYVKGTLKDFKVIYELEKQCFNKYDCFSEKTIKYFLNNPHNSIILDIIKFNNEIAGYSVYLTKKNSKKIRLYSICILAEFRGKKVALNYFKQRILYFSKYYSYIILEVRISNTRAINLYKKLGFQLKYILTAYYADGEDGLCLIKKLN